MLPFWDQFNDIIIYLYAKWYWNQLILNGCMKVRIMMRFLKPTWYMHFVFKHLYLSWTLHNIVQSTIWNLCINKYVRHLFISQGLLRLLGSNSEITNGCWGQWTIMDYHVWLTIWTGPSRPNWLSRTNVTVWCDHLISCHPRLLSNSERLTVKMN